MKKYVWFFIFLLVLTSCITETPHLVFKNTTKEDVIIRYFYDDTYRDIPVKANELEIVNYDIDNYVDARMVNNEGIIDNGVYFVRTGTSFYIYPQESEQYTVKVLIPSSAFDGSEALYLAESGNRIERYPVGKTVIKLEADSYMNITSYGNSFYLSDKDGSRKETLNGYPVSIIIKNDSIVIL